MQWMNKSVCDSKASFISRTVMVQNLTEWTSDKPTCQPTFDTTSPRCMMMSLPVTPWKFEHEVMFSVLSLVGGFVCSKHDGFNVGGRRMEWKHHEEKSWFSMDILKNVFMKTWKNVQPCLKICSLSFTWIPPWPPTHRLVPSKVRSFVDPRPAQSQHLSCST